MGQSTNDIEENAVAFREPNDLPAKGLALLGRLKAKTATVGVIGLGYVGLPLAVTAATRGNPVIGFEIDEAKIADLNAGRSYIAAVKDSDLSAVSDERLQWSSDVSRLRECDVIVICVPTPLSSHREPDLSYVEAAAQSIASNLTDGTLVVLESTTFPGTTDDVLLPILEQHGLTAGMDFFVASSPEREDPGNQNYHTATIPKIVGGDDEMARELALQFYSGVVDQVVPVSSSRTAEAVKITENIFRAVNIALVNELKVIYDAMDIDIWEVIDGAATKPFGFMPFYPGPGLGGHCIPIDPYYLTWKAREHNLATRFIELAGEVNFRMPEYVVEKTRDTIDRMHGRGLRNAKILIVGVAYKKNVTDLRESPALAIMKLLDDYEVDLDYMDPHIAEIPNQSEHPQFAGKSAIAPEAISAEKYDAVIIATDHDAIDYAALVALGVPIIDTRNAIEKRGLEMGDVIKA